MFKAVNQDRPGNKVNFLLTSALDNGIVFNVTLHSLASKLSNGIHSNFFHHLQSASMAKNGPALQVTAFGT